MKQSDAIETILSLVIKDSAVRAVFLKGSIAREECDNFSDVDFYCLVKEQEMDSFLKKRIHFMEQYKPLIFCGEVNFVGPQIVGVFNNGLHFDFYTVTCSSLHKTDKIKVLYDPENILLNYTQERLTIEKETLVKYYDSISFSLLEFEAAYCRNDLLWASRLGCDICTCISSILRYVYDIDNAQLGLKRLYKKLDKHIYDKLYNAMDLLGPSNVLKGVKILIQITNEITEKLPEDILESINMQFYNFMIEKIEQL